MNKYLDYDNANMRTSKKQLNSLLSKTKIKHHAFFDLPNSDVNELIKKANEVKKKFTNMIVIGIGGSNLGAKTIHKAIQSKGVDLHFIDNPDPATINKYIKLPKTWWKTSCILVVSKSGTTLETIAIFNILKKHTNNIYVITDYNNNPLYKSAIKNKYELLEHPSNIGGRFAVLSTVGLFPAACAGVNIKKLLLGAKSIEQKDAALFAVEHFLHYKKKRTIHVLMPYADNLFQFAFWYRQLWAESLGKKRTAGPTPVASLGAVDQHSQIQLYNQGPDDKVITFIQVQSFNNTKSLEKIMHASLKGTAKALTKHKRPNGTISIPSLSEESLGALFQFYTLSTAYMGKLLNINTYNQPGVEEGKKMIKKFL